MLQIGDELLQAAKPHYEIAIAGNVERGHADAGARERAQELPAAVDVAVPVEAAAKTGARNSVT